MKILEGNITESFKEMLAIFENEQTPIAELHKEFEKRRLNLNNVLEDEQSMRMIGILAKCESLIKFIKSVEDRDIDDIEETLDDFGEQAADYETIKSLKIVKRFIYEFLSN